MTRWLIVLLAVLVVGSIGSWTWRQIAIAAGPADAAMDFAPEPVDITVDPERLEAALASAPWVSQWQIGQERVDAGPNDSVLWVIGHRTCVACVGYLRSEAAQLGEAGVDVRVILFAPEQAAPEERAVIAEIGVRRVWATLRAYVEGSAADYHAVGRFPSAADPIRSAVIAAGRRTRDEIEAVMEANGYEVVYPLLFWREEAGAWRVAIGDTTRSRRAIRRTLAGEAGE